MKPSRPTRMMKPTQHEQSSDKLQDLAQIFTVLIGVIALFQWYQIAYRVRLFYEQNHGQKGLNHIGDGDFTLIYFANTLLLAMGIIAVQAFWRESRVWRVSAAVITSANLAGGLTLFFMHRTGVLVEYAEFLRTLRRGL